MTREDFIKIGLGFSKNDDRSTIAVIDWKKFFPQINLPTEAPLVELAKRSWFTLIVFCEHYIVNLNIYVRGVNASYHKTLYKLNITTTTEEDFLSIYCPYTVNDIRKFAWISVLNQFNYKKICNDIQKTITNLMKVKNDYKY